jgi:HEAT repeat protein
MVKPPIDEVPMRPVPERNAEPDTGQRETIRARDAIAREQRVLPPTEAAELLQHIQSAQPPGMNTALWEQEVNSTLNALRAQPELVPGLTDALLAMAKDSENPVLRLYALQHIAQVHSRETPEGKQTIEKALVEHALDDSRKMAGAALGFLGDIQPTSLSDETRERLAARAIKLTRDPDAPIDVRVSAIHACAAAGNQTAIPSLRETAADASANTVERRAAIHALGQLGGPDELAFLTSLASADSLLEPALRPAIERLSTTP